STFALVDIWWVNRIDDGWFGATPTGGKAAASIGLTESLMTIVIAIAFGVGAAGTAMGARRIGERGAKGAAGAGAQAIGPGLLFGLVTGVPAALCARPLLGWMADGDQSVVAVGHGYTAWVLGGNVIVTLLFLQNAIFRGAGDPMLALKTLMVANGINLVLDPCLIFGLGPFPALGVTGAAVATCTGRSAAVPYQTWLLHRGHGRIRLERLFAFDGKAMWKLVRLSAGTIGQMLIGMTSWVVLMYMVQEFGKAAGAGYTTG